MPNRKTHGQRSVQAVPGKSMGNYAKKKAIPKVQVQIVKPEKRVTLIAQIDEPEPKMIVCALFPEGPVEKPIAYHRRDPLGPVCKDCDHCTCSN